MLFSIPNFSDNVDSSLLLFSKPFPHITNIILLYFFDNICIALNRVG